MLKKFFDQMSKSGGNKCIYIEIHFDIFRPPGKQSNFLLYIDYIMKSQSGKIICGCLCKTGHPTGVHCDDGLSSDLT